MSGKVPGKLKHNKLRSSQPKPKTDSQPALETSPETSEVETAEMQRTVANPRQARPEALLAMQQSYGNQAVQRMLGVGGRGIVQRNPDTMATTQQIAQAQQKGEAFFKRFNTAAVAFQGKVAPAKINQSANLRLSTIAPQYSDSPVDTVVKPAVLQAAVGKVGAKGTWGKTKHVFGKGSMDTLAESAAAPLISQKVTELRKDGQSDGDIALDGLSEQAKLTKFLETVHQIETNGQIPDQMKGQRKYLSEAKLQSNRLLEANLGQSDAKEKIGEKLVSTFMDSELGSKLEKDDSIVKHWKDTKSEIESGIKGEEMQAAAKDVAQDQSWALTTLMSEMSNAVINIRGDLAKGKELSFQSLTILLDGMESAAQSAELLNQQVEEQIRDAVSVGLQEKAKAAATTAGQKATPKAVENVVKYIGKNEKKYVAVKEEAKKEVKSTLDAISKGQSLSPDKQQLLDNVKSQMEEVAGNASSKFRHIGTVIEKAMPPKAPAGSKLNVELTVKIPVDPQATGFIGFHLQGKAEHEMKAKEDLATRKFGYNPNTKVEFNIGVIGGGRLPFGLELLGELGMYAKAESPDGAPTAMENISYALYRRFVESKWIPREVSNWMWGAGGITAKKNEGKSEAAYKEAEAWGGGMEKRLEKGGSAETGAYGSAQGEIGVDKVAKFKGGLKFATGTKYDKDIVKERRGLGRGKGVSGRGAQSSVGQGTRAYEISISSSFGPFTISGKGTYQSLYVEYTPKEKDAAKKAGKTLKDGYQFSQWKGELAGLVTAPARDVGFDKLSGPDAAARISTWVMRTAMTLKHLIQKTQAAKAENRDWSNTEKASVSYDIGSLAYDMDSGTGAVEKGGNYAVQAIQGQMGGGGSDNVVTEGLKTGANTVKSGLKTASDGYDNFNKVSSQSGALKGLIKDDSAREKYLTSAKGDFLKQGKATGDQKLLNNLVSLSIGTEFGAKDNYAGDHGIPEEEGKRKTQIEKNWYIAIGLLNATNIGLPKLIEAKFERTENLVKLMIFPTMKVLF